MGGQTNKFLFLALATFFFWHLHLKMSIHDGSVVLHSVLLTTTPTPTHIMNDLFFTNYRPSGHTRSKLLMQSLRNRLNMPQIFN